MVKVKNINIGREENYEEGGSSRGGRTGKGKGKRVTTEVRLPERFISVKEAANFEEWTRKRRKIAPGHGVDLSDMEDYIPKQKRFDPDPYGERRFEELFSKGEVLKRHDDKNVNKLDACGRLLHHMISNIIIPNVGHKYSITNMHSFVMLALHKHRRMNIGFIAIKHILATQTSSTKCLPHGCFLTKGFQYFVLNLIGVGDHIGVRKIYKKHTFKRMGFSRNEDGMLVRGEQDDNDESDEDDEGNEAQEAMNVDEKESEEEPEEETFRKEMRQKKRQERAEEGQSSGSMSQLMEMVASRQTSMNSHFDALHGKISNIQEMMYKRSLKGNVQRRKKSLKTTRLYEDEVIKSKTLKTRRMIRDSFIRFVAKPSKGDPHYGIL
ncbi:hypothetical protein M9H77_29560 [Catharanthus roseus]|uniref:Uncharacterized protein n=1 Tax=Catharanthus roseus TaxID=4058 RepID=A0ACB9ZYZ6_CATRO|nr:hypothetical protein M9H77_29560 [Catharanthus roseus]